MSEATSGVRLHWSPHIAEPVIGRRLRRPVGSRGLLAAKRTRHFTASLSRREDRLLPTHGFRALPSATFIVRKDQGNFRSVQTRQRFLSSKPLMKNAARGLGERVD
jgi:hypothetical protein